ncbi:DNA repair protein RecN [soil metagenome]
MITHIHVQNFTIITSLDLELTSGMTVLTGETGAGKSIIIDAVNFALGSRAESSLVRHGCDRCDVSVSFDIGNNSEVKQWLQIQELESQEECLIRRNLTKEGRSRSSINGQPVTQQQVRELGNLLVTIYGQHAHHGLLKSEQQQKLLDEYAGLDKLCDEVKNHYRLWRKTTERLDALQNNNRDQTARHDFLRFQLDEFIKLAIEPNELQNIEQEHKQLAHAEQLLSSCSQAINLLAETETNNTIASLNQVLMSLKTVSSINPRVNNAYQLLETARITLKEAYDELRHYIESINLDPQHLQDIEQRLAQLHNLARKHRITTTELPTMQQQLQLELQQLEGCDKEMMQLQQDLIQLEIAYKDKATLLGQQRAIAAENLSKLVTDRIRQLGMPKGVFAITLETEERFTPTGLEKIMFLVSINPGQVLQPMHKVASGGELSRIGLALKVISTSERSASALIFDEVDVGIGGGTAEIVGQLLRQLATHAQVLCVTHLPQVAAQGHQHLQVEKHNANDHTYTQVKILSPAEKIKEIARMLGGLTITQHTLAHAEEMLTLAENS